MKRKRRDVLYFGLFLPVIFQMTRQLFKKNLFVTLNIHWPKQGVNAQTLVVSKPLPTVSEIVSSKDGRIQDFTSSRMFLIGRSLQNGLVSLGLVGKYADALMDLGCHLENLYEEVSQTILYVLDELIINFYYYLRNVMQDLEMEVLEDWLLVSWTLLQQWTTLLVNGEQVELPDYWLNYGSPWEIERLDLSYPIWFYGYVAEKDGELHWEPGEKILAVAYDYPIPGFNTYNTINIRLWSSKPSDEFDLESFNKGDYLGSIEERGKSENITNVLYPNDNTMAGKELRLKQQFLFVSATLQDILSQFKETGKPLKELMRLLVDGEKMKWEDAWDITTRTFSYTNHTVLPEALEKWSVSMVEHLLPRHIRIIYDINERFLKLVEKKWPGDNDKKRMLSIIDESDGRNVCIVTSIVPLIILIIRMAFLAIVGSHTINGVAKLHTELLKSDVFPLFYELWPSKFVNRTNGVTPRRWIYQCNPHLSSLLNKTLGTSRWVVNLDIISDIKKHCDDPNFQKEWMNIKRANKVLIFIFIFLIRMAKYIEKTCDIRVSVDSMFDVQVKRFHEYKRQLLNILGVIHRYLQIKNGKLKNPVPKVIIFAGKAAPGYYMAKKIIKLINSVANVINNDPQIGNLLKLVFIPNYLLNGILMISILLILTPLNTRIVPCSDVSQHISTAGTEASGTSNMKFSMNGGIILGTMDGANIEILEAIGKENMYIFGATSDQVNKIRKEIHDGTHTPDPRWVSVITAIKEGMFGEATKFQPILDSITNGHDHYILSHDFPSCNNLTLVILEYLDIDAQEKIDRDYQDKPKWAKMSILAAAGCGCFSSDRTIKEYADIWNLERCRRKGPMQITNEEASTLLASPSGSPVTAISIERLSPLTVVKPPSGSPMVVNKNEQGNLTTRQIPTPSSTTIGFDVKK
uniref:Alpha-1,4 glucan phosphorylase n=1 Tax=Cavenderia deminutiva TaxID=361123 RepID=A0A1L2FV25_9MYCE|nr:glycogen phosphorylase 2/a [Cavenderia deminutiva]